MNPHHLELFYFVAKYQGITEAVRKMPYGIQQPAVSGQILQLEKNLGVKLFRRRPFALTRAGEELYSFIEPFFSNLNHVAERLSGEESHHLRLAANASALAHHLPDVLQQLRSDYPDLRLTLKELTASEVESALFKQEADIAIAVMHSRPINGIKVVKLVELPLAILAPGDCQVSQFKDISSTAINGHIHSSLISLPENESAAQVFQKGLAKLNLSWQTTVEVTEISVIGNYVARGFGLGLAVHVPNFDWPPDVKLIPLPKSFPKIAIGAFYSGDLKPIAKHFLDLTSCYASRLSGND